MRKSGGYVFCWAWFIKNVIASVSEAIPVARRLLRAKNKCALAMTGQRLSLQRAGFHAMRSQILAEFLLHHRFVIGPVADVHFGL